LQHRHKRIETSEISRACSAVWNNPILSSFAGWSFPESLYPVFPKAAFKDAFAEQLSGRWRRRGLSEYSTSEGQQTFARLVAAQIAQAIGIPATPDTF